MAENAVILALAKVSNALEDEVLNFGILSLFSIILILTSLQTRMKSIENELLVMKKFLRRIDLKLNDKAFKTWLGQVKVLASLIEDTIDEYVFLIYKQSGKGLFNFVKRVLNLPFTLFKMWIIALRLKNLKIELITNSQMKDRWIHIINNESNMESMHPEGKRNQSNVHDFVKEDELVGIERSREKLENLIQIEEESLLVITVWGMGGLGKTTLVNNVYKNEIKKFDCHAWISISQSYKMEDLLREIIVQLNKKKDLIPNDIKVVDKRILKETLKIFLNHKKCLIVLDDVWTPDVCAKLRNLFPENSMGSRIIITTRMNNVALLANESCKLEIETLNECNAYDLFCKRAFWKHRKHLCPPELDILARKIVRKCKGLPLALVSIGSLLSRKEKSETEWNRVYNKLNWELENNPNLSNVKNILYLSYNYLPEDLKNCFLYCSMFPEDYIIKTSRLVRLWIGEGFIKEKRGLSNLEEVAEGYLSELVQRSLLQLVDKNSFGGVRLCRMHDIVRELAISLSKKESFHEIYDENSRVQLGEKFGFNYTRRLSVINSIYGIESRENNMSQIRSFIAFNISMSSSISLHFIFSKSKYLTVLDLQYLPIETIPESIGDLLNLKCLHLRRTNVQTLPETIVNLINLQSLDLTETKVQNLPSGLANLNKLRHLFAWRCTDKTYKSVDFCRPVNGIRGLEKLQNLQTLVAVEATENFISQLGNMNQLRSICITNLKARFCLQLCKSLKELRFLTRLEIFSGNGDEILQMEYLNPLPPNLKKLYINGKLAEGTLDSPYFLNRASNLKVFDLGWSQLENNPFLSLSRLSWLTTMRLVRVYNGKNICFCAGWFPNLKVLYMMDFLNVDKIVFEEGSLMNLARLRLEGLKMLKDLHGIKFLKSVEKLFLLELHADFKLKWKRIDVLKILPHISVLQIE